MFARTCFSHHIVAIKSRLYSAILQWFHCQQCMLSFRKAVLQMIERLQSIIMYHVNELLVSLFTLKHVCFLTLTFCCPVIVIADKVHPFIKCLLWTKNALPDSEHFNTSVSVYCVVSHTSWTSSILLVVSWRTKSGCFFQENSRATYCVCLFCCKTSLALADAVDFINSAWVSI